MWIILFGACFNLYAKKVINTAVNIEKENKGRWERWLFYPGLRGSIHEMLKVVVSSQNPVKVNATKGGFRKVFPGKKFQYLTVSVPSGVNDQPMGDAESFRGARNRALNAKKQIPDADYWVGIEGGVQKRGKSLCPAAWVVVLGKSGVGAKRVIQGQARTGLFYLPQIISDLVLEGKELGEADDIVFGQSNSKQQNGGVGLMTDNVIDRARFYEDAVVLALIPFKKQALFSAKTLADYRVNS
jgi:inosine/xanthosine triphosphatase